MAFTIYRSGDVGAPALYGSTGSLINVLDYCLYTGSGWLKPYPNSASAGGDVYACYQQPTGSGFTLFINDNAPNGTSLYKEAWATGWELFLGHSGAVGSGSGQFPLPAQLLTTGHTVIRKSSVLNSTTTHDWIVAADSMSFYLFISTGDVAAEYSGFGFGDIYSFKSGSSDDYKCIIMGRNAENSATSTNDGFEMLSAINNAAVGNFMARTYTGLDTSITVGKHGDGVKGHANYWLGNIPYPNFTDTALYLSPIWVCENASSILRGQLRGLYQLLHPVAGFSDGQTFSGSGDYNGKTFMLIKNTMNSGIFTIETSDTLLTN